MAKKRSIKVYGQSGYKYQETPTIMLKGMWLKELGFNIGDYISVTCEDGRLVITPDAEYREASDTPVIILTAKDLETDEVTRLTLGADDYITKPFSLMVLRARIDKVLQKRQMFSGNSYSDDEYSFDFDRMEFLARGMSVELSKTEQKLLRAGQAFKHQDRREEAHLQF